MISIEAMTEKKQQTNKQTLLVTRFSSDGYYRMGARTETKTETKSINQPQKNPMPNVLALEISRKH